MTATLGIGSEPSDSGTFARLVDVTVCQPSITEVELPGGPFRRPLRMEVRVTPWHSGRALVELVPREQRVRLTGAYFAAGHRLLDQVIDELVARDRVRWVAGAGITQVEDEDLALAGPQAAGRR